MKKNQKLLLLLLMMAMLLPTFAMAETPVIVNLVENPDAEYHFEDGAKILEIVFPRVYSSDCILLRYDGMVMMIDASTKNATMRNRTLHRLRYPRYRPHRHCLQQPSAR